MNTKYINHFLLLDLLLLLVIPLQSTEISPAHFDTVDLGASNDKVPMIQPWKKILLEPKYSGQWIVTGDVDGDGEADIISARNVNDHDVHYTSAVVAQRLDGSVIWRWGNPAIGRKELSHDVACQIYDWNHDGKNEVVLLSKGYLVELDGQTGKERRRFPIPPDASDCLVFANLSGNQYASDVLVKTRYTQIWAYNYAGDLLWTVKNPGGYRTAHQPRPIDLDHDNHDEIMAGYAMLNSDGSVRWIFHSDQVDQSRGHLDCCRILKSGKTPEDYRLVLTCCGANNIALVDGFGKNLWEVSGHHFESVQVGQIFPELSGPQILVDIDHRPRGESPIWILDEQGNHLGQVISEYCRHHNLIDWTGDGYQEFIIAQSCGIFDHSGKRIATFYMDPETMDSDEQLVIIGDMTGDAIPDVTLSTLSAVYIYKNEKGLKSNGKMPLGSGINHTLY